MAHPSVVLFGGGGRELAGSTKTCVRIKQPVPNRTGSRSGPNHIVGSAPPPTGASDRHLTWLESRRDNRVTEL